MLEYTEDNLSEITEEDHTEELLAQLGADACENAAIMLDRLTKIKNRSAQIEASDELCASLDGDVAAEERLVSHFELIRMVNVQSETVMRYIREGKLLPDQIGPDNKPYFTLRSVKTYAKRYGWQLISIEKLNELFYEVLSGKRMSYSYKPVLVKAMLVYASPSSGECRMSEVIAYFRAFYGERRLKGLFVEKERSVFTREIYSDREARNVILTYPYKRFADMQLMHYDKENQIIGFHPYLWNGFSYEEKERIESACEKALKHYYARFAGSSRR